MKFGRGKRRRRFLLDGSIDAIDIIDVIERK